MADGIPSPRRGLRPRLAHYTLTIRNGAQVRKEEHPGLDETLQALEREGREIQGGAHEHAEGGALFRRLDPVQIVVARLEVTGPGRVHAGVDVRGDGSSEAFTGRLRRRVIEQRNGETSYDALRRELTRP